jgi:hypothetical protein
MVSGYVSWPNPQNPIWQFSWGLTSDPEGIAIYGARFRRHLVLYKASIPSLRVQYDGPNPCGPYKDPLNEADAQAQAPCYFSKVCSYSINLFGLSGIRVQAFHRIGQYRLIERWDFMENGWVYPRLYSSGLQCPRDHRHHVYWRFDFDINEATPNLVLEYNTNTPNLGYGPGWHKKAFEISRLKNPTYKRSWAIADKTTWRGYHLLPGVNDGYADSFSHYDLVVLRYHYAEDKHGNQGDAYDDALGPYLNGENIDGQDVVLWYVSHLFHHVEGGGDEWHGVGPSLAPFRNWW